MKRIIASVGVVALMAASAMPALATRGFFPPQRSTDTLDNYARVTNDVNVSSNTGKNLQVNLGAALGGTTHNSGPSVRSFGGGYPWGGSDVELNQKNVANTGNAGAGAIVTTEANNGTGCGCFDDVENTAKVYNYVTVRSNTGMNIQGNLGLVAGGSSDAELNQANYLTTGDAVSTADLWTVVNSSYSAQ